MEIFSTECKETSFTDGTLALKYYLGRVPFRFYWLLEEKDQQVSQEVAVPLLLALKQTKDRELGLMQILQKEVDRRDPLSQKPKIFDNFQRTTPFDCIEVEENQNRISVKVAGFKDNGFTSPFEGSAGLAEQSAGPAKTG